MKQSRHILLALTTSALLASCGGGGSSSSSSAINSYDGQWANVPNCNYDNEDGFSIKSILKIAGTQSVMTITAHDSTNCSGNTLATATIKHAFKYGKKRPNASSVCSNTREIDVTLQGGTFNNANETAAQTAARYKIPQSGYDLICTASNRLYFGDSSGNADGTSAANRPSVIDSSEYQSRN